MISVLLFFWGGVSFRSIPRIVRVLNRQLPLTLPDRHFTSIIHWCLKVGLYRLQRVLPSTEPWTAIVDASIEWGKKKILLVLRVPTDIMCKRSGALSLSDVEVVSMTVHDTLNGDVVNSVLHALTERLTMPTQILSDGGYDLARGIRLLATAADDKPLHTLDIGHYFANRLKAYYSDHEQFKALITFARQVGHKLRQTTLAWLVPNKLRKKGRFQSLSIVAQWAKKAFDYYTHHTIDHNEKERQQLEENFANQAHLAVFADSFNEDCQVINAIEKIIKRQGLSRSTYEDCMRLLSSSQLTPTLRTELIAYLSDHMQSLNQHDVSVGLMSTDVIECLFGKFKAIKERSPLKDFNKLTLLIPMLVGTLTEAEIVEALSCIKIKEIKAWEDEHIGSTQLKKRRQYFGNKHQDKHGEGNNVPNDAEALLPKAA